MKGVSGECGYRAAPSFDQNLAGEAGRRESDTGWVGAQPHRSGRQIRLRAETEWKLAAQELDCVDR